MRATLTVILVTMCMLPVLQVLTPQVKADNITIGIDWFGNGKMTALVEFQSAGIDDTNNLSVQTGLYIDEASLKISTMPQGPGSKAYPNNLTVDFGGDSKLEYQFKGQGYGQFGRQTTFKTGKDFINMSIGGGQSNDTLAIRVPKNANIRSATMNISVGSRIGTPGSILIIYATGYPGCANDVQTKLQAFPDFTKVDMWDARLSTPDLATLEKYWSVLVWNHGYNGYRFADQNTLGNNLADYTDEGAGVVLMCYLFSGGWNGHVTGRFANENYYVIPQNNNGMSGSYPMVLAKSAGQQNHPVFTNVTSVQMNDYVFTVQPGVGAGEELARWSNPSSVAVGSKSVKGVDRVDLQYMPYSSSVSYPMYSAGWTGDGDDLIKNSLLFAGRKPFTGTIDILNDTEVEFNQSNFQGNYTFTNLADLIRNYLATANASFTDPWGNEMVDVPINVSAAMPGLVRFDNLEVTYDYTTDIKPNPAFGDLASSLAEIQQSNLGTENFTIPIVVSSESAGQVKLSDLHIKMSPPVHAPTINSFFPAATLVLKENTQLDFGIDVVDWYGNPMTTTWFFDGTEVTDSNRSTFSHFYDYDSAGNHTVRVAIQNGLSTAEQVWSLTVLNQNRAPVIADFLPAADPTIDENATQMFRVNATDPDNDPLGYRWTLDGKVQPDATASSFLFRTDFFSAGDHTVKALVSDSGGMASGRNWTVHVQNVNVPPAITAFSPKTNPRILERENWQFSVTPFDMDGQTLTSTWYIDDVQAFVGNPFVYTTDYRSAGVHKITATVSDGKETASRSWDITVINVNRAPVAAIDAPLATDFMQNAAIHFSAASSFDADNETLAFSWKEGGVNVSDQMEFDRVFNPGLHTLALEVRDPLGGVSSASVRFRVRFVEISVLIGLDRLELTAGDKVDIITTLSNVGDTNATEVGLEVLVDGKSVGTKSYADMEAGGGAKEIFKWKATVGTHTITAKVGEQTWTKEVTVQKATEVKNTFDYASVLWPLLIVVVLIALVVFGAAAMRKK